MDSLAIGGEMWPAWGLHEDSMVSASAVAVSVGGGVGGVERQARECCRGAWGRMGSPRGH